MTVRLEADGWSARLAHLAALTRVDALAIVLPSRDVPTTYAAHNLPPIAWSNTPAAATIMNVLTQRSPGQLGGAGIPLAAGGTAEALAATPIVWRDQLVGALVAASARAINPDDMSRLSQAADLVAIDLADANFSWRAQRQVHDLEGRARVARDLQRTMRQRDIDALLERATNQVADLFGADGVSIMLADDSGQLIVRGSRGLSDEARRAKVGVGVGISGGVARSGQPTLLSGPVAGGSDDSVSEAMIVPLRVGERTLGVMNVKHRTAQQGKYNQTQLDALALVAQDIASIYVMADELTRAEDDRQQAIVLYELSRFTALGSDPSADLASATAMLAGTLRHDAVAVWQLAANDRLLLRAATGYEVEPGSTIHLDESDTTLATALREKKSARTEIDSEQRPAWAAPSCTKFLLAPIGAHGVLVFGRIAGEYNEGDVEFCTTVADYMVGMIQKSGSEDVVLRGVSAERRRIAQELHDGLAQELTGVVLALEGCQRAFEKEPSLVAPQLQKAARDARATLADVRQYMAALRQSETGGLNLPVTLARLVDDLKRQTALPVQLDETGPPQELEPIVERAVIRIVGEALRNVAQHAGAKQAKVALVYGPEGVMVTIEDDGRGFDVDGTFSSAEGSGHFGIVGMRERAEAAGGQLVVRSEVGSGTIVRASIPYNTLIGLPAMAGEPIEDIEQQQSVEDQDTSDRGGFFTRLFGR